jgi:branched-subunit amino acid transport protein
MIGLILGMALVTYLTRGPALLLLRGDLPAWLRRWLRYVPIAVFTALVVPPFIAPRGVPELQVNLVVGLVATLVAWRTRRMYAAILAGLLTFALVRAWG